MTDTDSQAPTSAWQKVREEVLQRDQHECQFCGLTANDHKEQNGSGLDVHHIIPRKHGGKDRLSNLVALCRSCHKTMESLHSRAMGALSHPDQTEVLAEVQAVKEASWEKCRVLDEKLRTFADGHPIFTEQMGVYVEDVGKIRTRAPTLAQAIPTGDGAISSEWEFVAALGYREGRVGAVMALEDLELQKAVDVPTPSGGDRQ